MGPTTDIRGRNAFRTALFESPDFVSQKLLGKLGLQQRVGSGRTTAEMRLIDGCQFESQVRQQAFDQSVQFLAVLKGTGRMERDSSDR